MSLKTSRGLFAAMIVLGLGLGSVFGQGGTGREPQTAPKSNSAKPTPSSGSRSTSTSKETDDSSATLEETMKWIGERLATRSLYAYRSIIVGSSATDYWYTKDLPGSPQFDIDGCEVILKRTYTMDASAGHGQVRDKLVIPFADIDPHSIRRTADYSLEVRAVRPTLKILTSYELIPADNVDESSVEASFRFVTLEDAKSFEKAVRHVVKLCGGKPSKF